MNCCTRRRGAAFVRSGLEMGIKNLTKIIQEVAPAAIKEITLKELMGRRVAIDASMAIYQFLVRWAVPRSSLTALLQLSHHRSRWQVAVRSAGEGMAPSAMLMNEAGEVTSHLQGMFSRTIRLMESGVKPLYVFDGKAPTLKSGELAKRKEAKDRALADLKVAEEKAKDDTLTAEAADEVRDEMDKLSKRTVHMDKTHQEDCKRLLRLMGVPVVEAPCEAEAQCAILAKAGLVYGAATEDMDTLCFGTPKLIRRLTMSEARKMPVWEFDLARILADTELSMDQFVDMCILCGCDYLEPIKGIGPKTALTLIRKHGTLADTITALRADDKYTVPEEYPIEDARRLFTEPDVADPSSMS